MSSNSAKTAKLPSKQWTHDLTVVGLRFRWPKDDRAALAAAVARRAIDGIRIEREPDNKYDENALAVYLPARLREGKQLGYLPREVAEVLAPKLDAGAVTIVRAKLRDLDPSGPHPYNSGTLEVTFRRS